MASLKTDLRAAQFDSLRQTEGIVGSLTLYRAMPTGYEVIISGVAGVSFDAGWFAQRERDEISGDQFFAVRIAMTDGNRARLTATVTSQMAAVRIGDLRYKIRAKVAPFDDPAIWALQCDPTGEAAN